MDRDYPEFLDPPIKGAVMKECKWCGAMKNKSEFYKHEATRDGLHNHCIPCHNEYVARYCRKNKKRQNVLVRAWQSKNKDHVAAKRAVAEALRSGRLVRQSCEICGEKKSEAHHDDYSKPLDVIFLCKKHHEQRHHKLGWDINGEKQMRPKYKLGNYIKFSNNGTDDSGNIEGIITRKEGYSYLIGTGEDELEVNETDVLAAFREVKPRTAAPRKATTAKKGTNARKKADNSVHAAA